MMDTEQAFVAALRDNPADATTWLVLADWLEEEGRERQAQLVRCQRALAGLPEGRERDALEIRVRGLLLEGTVPWVPVLTNSIGMELTLVPPGKFWLGSSGTEVAGARTSRRAGASRSPAPFYLGTYPVTQEEYATVTGRNPSGFSPAGRQAAYVRGTDTRRFPVETVTWAEAAAFCRRLSEIPDERRARRVYRLPTEAEWEYACRGGVLSSRFPWGTRSRRRWPTTGPRSGRTGRPRQDRMPTPVGSYLPNGFGLFDVVGNVWEWCADWFASDAYERARSATRGPGRRRQAGRPGRGVPPPPTPAAVRRPQHVNPIHRECDLGLRVLLEWSPGTGQGLVGRHFFSAFFSSHNAGASAIRHSPLGLVFSPGEGPECLLRQLAVAGLARSSPTAGRGCARRRCCRTAGRRRTGPWRGRTASRGRSTCRRSRRARSSPWNLIISSVSAFASSSQRFSPVASCRSSRPWTRKA